MKSVIGLVILTALAACGVDGAPTRPESNGVAVDVKITGTAEVGVVGSL